MDLSCFKGRVAPRAGENDADKRRSFVFHAKGNLSAVGSDSTPARLILQAVIHLRPVDSTAAAPAQSDMAAAIVD
jgi:hypothetical protein